ncbi:hypothetical protein BH10PSE9_BH10PSE9_26190 [soil metagenome]
MWRMASKQAEEALAAMTPEEDAAITADALSDPDNPPLSDALLARMRPVAEVAPELIVMSRRRGERGPQKAPTKKLVSIRLSPDVLDHFRAEGEGWQTRIDDVLRKFVERKRARA